MLKIELTQPVDLISRLKPFDTGADNDGMIPPNLATLTESIIRLHLANGDIAWIADMVHDIELAARKS